MSGVEDPAQIYANTGGFLIAGYFLSAPVAWLGGYVARINQIASQSAAAGVPTSTPPAPELAMRRTKTLTVREVEVTQLLSAGLSNDEIASQLVVSPRTIQSHVANALRKTSCRNRTELGVLAKQEGLVP